MRLRRNSDLLPLLLYKMKHDLVIGGTGMLRVCICFGCIHALAVVSTLIFPWISQVPPQLEEAQRVFGSFGSFGSLGVVDT